MRSNKEVLMRIQALKVYLEPQPKISKKISNQDGLEELELTLLQIRRNEKDYLLRTDQQYVDNVHSYVSQLKTQITITDKFEPSVKTELRTQADAYLAAFDSLVALDNEIVIYNEALINAARGVEPLTTKIESLGEQLATEDIAAARFKRNSNPYDVHRYYVWRACNFYFSGDHPVRSDHPPHHRPDEYCPNYFSGQI